MVRIRPARRDDLSDIVAVMNAVDVAQLGEADTTEQDVAGGWEESGFDLEADAFVAESQGRLMGYAELYHRGADDYDLDVFADPGADPSPAGPLLDAALQRAQVHAGAGSRLATWVPVGDPTGEVYAERGFEPLRQFVRMRHSGDHVVAAPDAPHGVVVRQFDAERDARAVYDVLRDAFAHHVRPMAETFEQFTERHMRHADFNPAFWAVAVADGDIVGAITAFNHGDIGFIRHVGVTADRRGRGIGGALVAWVLHELGVAGQRRVDLGVDVEDEVGAVRLYESLGFTTLQRLQLVGRQL